MVKKNKINVPINNSNSNSNSNPNPLIIQQQAGNNSNVSFFLNPLRYLNDHILYLNSSKFFAGIVMIMLNVGSKFISIQFSKSTEEYLKYSLSRQLLIFAMAWMGTRDIYTALILTAIFVILSDHLFNEESSFCIVPHKNRVLDKLIDKNDDGDISETELNSAIAVLEKSKKNKQIQSQKDAYLKFASYTPLGKV